MVLNGISGTPACCSTAGGTLVVNDMWGWRAVPAAGTEANWREGPQKFNGNAVPSALSGTKVLPEKIKSNFPSARCSNLTVAEPYWPGKESGILGKSGFTCSSANKALLKKAT